MGGIFHYLNCTAKGNTSKVDSGQGRVRVLLEMSSKYQKPYVIPEGFPELLKGFTREILRAQVARKALQA